MAGDVGDQPLAARAGPRSTSGFSSTWGPSALIRPSSALRSRKARPPRAASQPSSGLPTSPTSTSRTRGHPLPDRPAPVAERDASLAVPSVRGASSACSSARSAVVMPVLTMVMGQPPGGWALSVTPSPRPDKTDWRTKFVSCSISPMPSARRVRLSARPAPGRPVRGPLPGRCWPLVVFVATVVVAAADLPADAARRAAGPGPGRAVRAGVVCCARGSPSCASTTTGYRVATGARRRREGRPRWTDVEDAVTASPRGVPCVVLRLRDGGTTTIPVQALAVDRTTSRATCATSCSAGRALRPL